MRGVARAGRGSGLLVALTASLMATYSCSSSDEAPLKGLAEGCLINTDCNAPLVCAFRKCHEACRDSRDCNVQEHQRCVASDRPYHVCQLDEERDCTFNSDCTVGQTCGVDFQCRDQCAADRDCLNAQVCLAGACADLAELDAGLLTGDVKPDAAAGQRCLYTSECPGSLVCRGHICSVECRAASDCPSGFDCVNNRCVPGAGTSIGVAGGVLSSASGQLELTIPAGALAAPVSIAIFPIQAWPRGAIGPVFEIVPSGTMFMTPATLVYHYDVADLGTTSPSALRLALAAGAGWSPLSSTVDATAGLVTTTIAHLSVYGVIGPDGTFAPVRDAGADAPADGASSNSANDAMGLGDGGGSGGAGGSGAGVGGAGGSGGGPIVDAGQSGSGGAPLVDAFSVDSSTGGAGGGGADGFSAPTGSGGSSGSGGSPPDASTSGPADASDEPLPVCFGTCDGCLCFATCGEATYSFSCGPDADGDLICRCGADATTTFMPATCDVSYLGAPGCGYPYVFMMRAVAQ